MNSVILPVHNKIKLKKNRLKKECCKKKAFFLNEFTSLVFTHTFFPFLRGFNFAHFFSLFTLI